MKSTLTAAEYHDAPRDIREQVDAWLEKIGMIDAGVVEIRVMHRLRDGKAFVSIGYCLRRKDGRYDRAADGIAKVDYVNIECDMPPLGFFLIEAKH